MYGFSWLTISWLLVAGAVQAQNTQVTLIDKHRLTGDLLAFEKHIGLLLLLGQDTLFIDWANYRKHRVLRKRTPFTIGHRGTDSTAYEAYLPSAFTNRIPRATSNRIYTEFGFSIPDGLAEADGFLPAPGVAFGIGYRHGPRLSTGLFMTFNSIRGYEVLAVMAEARLHLRPTLTSPYIAYRIGSGFATTHYGQGAQSPKIGLNTYGGVGWRYGRNPRVRQYAEIGLRTFKADFPLFEEGLRFNFQQYLSYAWGIRF